MLAHVLLGVCDHSAANATDELLRKLREAYEVRVIVTQGSRAHLSAVPCEAIDDAQEWYQWQKVREHHPCASTVGSHACTLLLVREP